ncbi:hypothetical protein [Jeotgalibacillus malaysiensis]|uniref:hypothetical protein n=1 Tax=Jeotgalibacillus malaysiensis TaxID=1508404 RepID=UPI00384D35CA
MKKCFRMMMIFFLVLITTSYVIDNAQASSYLDNGKEYTGYITNENKEVRYSFVLDKPSEVSFETTTEVYGNRFNIYDDMNNALDSIFSQGSKATPQKSTITLDLKPGKYTFVSSVIDFSREEGKYSFKMKKKEFDVNEIEPNDGTTGATSIVFDKKYSGHLAYNDQVDYYKFEVPAQGMIELNGEGFIAGGTNIAVYDANNKSITRDHHSGSKITPSKFNETLYLKKGTYYIEFYTDRHWPERSGAYNFSVSFSNAHANETEPNDGTTQASEIKFGNKNKGFIAMNDTIDYYSFTNSKTEDISFSIESYLNGGLDFTIYDENNKSIRSKYTSSTHITPGVINFTENLPAGKYYIAIERGSYYDSYGNYNFTIGDSAITKFKDYSANAYWTQPFIWGMANDVIKGDVKSMKLSPYNKLNEVQWLAMIFRYSKPDEVKEDKNNWTKVYYDLSKKYSIPNSGKPYSALRRGDVAVIMAQAFQGKKVSEREAIQWMYDNNLTTGKDPSKPKDYANFGANDSLARAQAVVFLYRAIEEQDLEFN